MQTPQKQRPFFGFFGSFLVVCSKGSPKKHHVFWGKGSPCRFSFITNFFTSSPCRKLLTSCLLFMGEVQKLEEDRDSRNKGGHAWRGPDGGELAFDRT
jgi:hypothetical protein